MNPKYLALIILSIVAIFIGGYFLTKPSTSPDATKYDTFAKCLADNKLTMYGAYWCPHCQNEKKAFSESFQYVPYVECTQQTKLCLDKGINSYPTWIDAAGKKYEGEQGLQKLSQIANCVLP